MSLPTHAATRKTYPIARGLFAYFPDAAAEVSHVSFVANEQHNPGQPMHWDKSKSSDEDDAMLRHLLDRITGTAFDTDGLRHRAKLAWRAMAGLQREIDAENAMHDSQERMARTQAHKEAMEPFLAKSPTSPTVTRTRQGYDTIATPLTPEEDDYRGIVESYESYLEALGEKADAKLQGPRD